MRSICKGTALSLCAALAAGAACGENSIPTKAVSVNETGSADSARVTTSRTFTLSGRVTERNSNGVTPSAGAYVNAWIQEASRGWAYWYLNGRVVADDSGRYKLPGIPAGATAQLQVWKDGFLQQCAAPLVTIGADLSLDAQIVVRASVSASATSVPEPAPGFRHVSGIVYDGGRPLADAFADYEPIMDFVGAFTFTDSDGRFLLCGLPRDVEVTVGVGHGGRAVWVSVPPGQTSGVEIDLSR